MTNSLALYAIHGFLGAPSDWDVLTPFVFTLNIIAKDIFKVSPPEGGFEKWAEKFNQNAKEKEATHRVLLGYSLGGRLALHALLQKPSLWSAAIFISSHPGLDDQRQREHRINEDCVWSKRFQNDSWMSLMSDWNSRLIFHNTFEPVRQESAYSRKQLSEALFHWSLGKQEFLWPQLVQVRTPVLWLTGENDASSWSKYQTGPFVNPRSEVKIIPGAGHRALWDQPKLIGESIYNFIKEALQPCC